jgi:hypothetical protein
VAEKVQEIGTVRYTEPPAFFLRSKPGIYRFDMEIRKRDGRLLKSYSRHVRVLPERVRLRIATNQLEFQAGEVAIGRIQNLGTLPAFVVSLPYLRVESFSNDEWTTSITEPNAGPFELLEGVILGGRAGWCRRFAIPSDATGSRYRFSAVVEASLGGKLKKRILTTAFSVN